MKIELHEILIKDLVKGYIDNQEEGVWSFNGKLNIRPKYQREFIYKDEQRNAVMDTVQKNFPLNVMYWVKNDNIFEVLDGQQRTISICQYVNGEYGINARAWQNLTIDEQNQILNYKLMIYFCEGTEPEKLAWFRIINIAGVKLADQELRHAVFAGTWLTDAKKYFSKNGCPAFGIGSDYLSGIPNRQDYLETAINWLSNENIEKYMAKNQHKPNANELWLYFQSVINWTKTVFSNYRKEMKGVEFGFLYNEFKDKEYDSKKIEKEIIKLMQDEDVTKKSGIYSYVLTRKEKYLSIRDFTNNQKRETYEKQKGICPKCKKGKNFEINEMEADHITPWSKGGKTTVENCQLLCKEHNRIKSAV